MAPRASILTRGLFILLVALMSRPLTGAPADATIEGIVLDPSGAVVPGAGVTLKRGDGTPVSSTTSDQRGSFSFEHVLPGRYDVEARREGFKVSISHAAAGAGKRRSLRIVLEIASYAEEVTVGLEGLSTRSAENRDSVSVDQDLLKDIPVFDQDFIGTLSAFLDPGAIGSSGVSLVVNGVEANRVTVPLSAIKEVKINQNPYSAEFFRPGRGRIEVVTKQEAPAYHGVINFVLRDSTLNARDFFAVQKAPEQRRIYEGSVGGPLGASKSTTFQLSLDRREEDVQAIVVASGLQGDIRENVPVPQRSTDFSGRLTRQLGTKHTLWVEYALEDRGTTNQGAGGFTLPEAAANAAYHEDNLNLSHQYMPSAAVVNQFYLHLEWNHGSTTSVNPGRRVVVQDAFTGGGAQADQRSAEMDVKLFETLSWSLGRHLFKAGFQAAEWSHRTYDDLSNREGTFFFSSLDDYAQGRPYAFLQQAGNGHVALLQQILGGYVQDEMQLRPDLSVALGARYDYQSFLRGGLLSPRLYTAFAPGKKRAVVLRAGVGIFNDRFPPSTFADVLRLDGQHLNSYLLLDPSYPNPTPATLPAQPTSLVRLDPGIRTPYSVQYSAGAEWQVAKGASLTATYRGDRGVSLFRSRDVNAPLAPDFSARPNAALGRVRQIESAGRQAGDAFEIGFRGKVGKTFSGLAQYTLSRARNNTSGVGFFPASSQDPLGEWAPADFEQRHRFNFLGTVAVRRGLKLGVGFSAASGKPYTVTTGRDDNHDGFVTDRAPGVARNGARAPGFADLDLKISRDISFAPGKGDKAPTATVAIDLFNVFNSFSPAAIVGNQSSPYFGQAVTALPPRRVQLSGRFTF